MTNQTADFLVPRAPGVACSTPRAAAMATRSKSVECERALSWRRA